MTGWRKFGEQRQHSTLPSISGLILIHREVLHLWSIAGVETDSGLPGWKLVSGEKSEYFIKDQPLEAQHFYQT